MRKLAALTSLITSITLSVKYTNSNNIDSILITWLTFGLLCMGIITFEQILKFNGKQDSQVLPDSSKGKS